MQPDQILPRVVHAVAVVDAQAGDLFLSEQLPDQAMRLCAKTSGFSMRRPTKIVHVEEAAIVDLLRRSAPVGEPVGLHIQQRVQGVEAVRIAFHPVDGGQRIGVNRRLCSLFALSAAL